MRPAQLVVEPMGIFAHVDSITYINALGSISVADRKKMIEDLGLTNKKAR